MFNSPNQTLKVSVFKKFGLENICLWYVFVYGVFRNLHQLSCQYWENLVIQSCCKQEGRSCPDSWKVFCCIPSMYSEVDMVLRDFSVVWNGQVGSGSVLVDPDLLGSKSRELMCPVYHLIWYKFDNCKAESYTREETFSPLFWHFCISNR